MCHTNNFNFKRNVKSEHLYVSLPSTSSSGDPTPLHVLQHPFVHMLYKVRNINSLKQIEIKKKKIQEEKSVFAIHF